MVSIDLFSYADAHAEGPVDRLYRELREQTVLADRLGYRRLWLTEQHLTAPGRVPDSLQMLAHLAAATTRIRLATGVLPAAVHHPVLLLESVLQLDALSGGRVDLGIGSGSEAGSILEVLGIGTEDAAERTADLYELLAQVVPGRPVTVRTGPEEHLDVALDRRRRDRCSSRSGRRPAGPRCS
jgi:alkanesulfonate monooxygenase SsuD/methylene tetrahydromethanopterin reductase-like flavin-dependent oxidoreductase (luciferase family)